MFPVGGDIAMLSEDGILPISQLLKTDRAVASTKALTSEIRQAFSEASQRSRDAFGWQMISHPIRNMALVNVPASQTFPIYQFVLNTSTGAWARFVNQDALCWGTYDNKLYFGSDNGKVYRADFGGSDATEPISAAVLPAYSHLGKRGRLKHVKMVQPIYSSDLIQSSPAVSIAIDYELPTTGSTSEAITGDWFTWDESLWDGADTWFGFSVHNAWRGSGNLGAVVSPYTTIAVDASGSGEDFKYRITGWTLVYELGGVL